MDEKLKLSVNGENGRKFFEPLNEKYKLSFSDVGGLNELKKQANIKIIQPFKNPELFKKFKKSADTAATYCEQLSLAGYHDWKLPSKSELVNLYSKKNQLKNISFNYCYWSSTTYEHSNIYAWVVDFNNGDVSYSGKGITDYVRCVRGRQ